MWRPQGTTQALAPQKFDSDSSLRQSLQILGVTLEVKPYSTSSARTGNSGGGGGVSISFLGNFVRNGTLSNLQYIRSWITNPPHYQIKGFFAPSAKRSRAEPRDAEDEVRNKVVLNGNSLIKCFRL